MLNIQLIILFLYFSQAKFVADGRPIILNIATCHPQAVSSSESTEEEREKKALVAKDKALLKWLMQIYTSLIEILKQKHTPLYIHLS